uniref:Cadherin domain-containing protein n=1 Tax=Timema tahoe TaxID=61484 RepID=A0A7R9IMR2_9NEOP|nr:unnamed protein product [Timema tahoe]
MMLVKSSVDFDYYSREEFSVDEMTSESTYFYQDMSNKSEGLGHLLNLEHQTRFPRRRGSETYDPTINTIRISFRCCSRERGEVGIVEKELPKKPVRAAALVARGIEPTTVRSRFNIECSRNKSEGLGHLLNLEHQTRFPRRRGSETYDPTINTIRISFRCCSRGEPPLHTDVDLLIRVGVLGNQRPTFRRTPNIIDNSSSYSASIHENAQPGSNVVTVIATDPDGQDSLLQYFIANGAKDKFVINRSSGQISVSPDANFDLETEGSIYKIVVLAVDAGTPIHETATTTVTVNIIDVNNKPPIFPGNPSTYTCYVSESAAIGTFVFFATADDPDTDAILEYSIIEPIRAVDRSGIFLKSTIPYNYKEIFKINSTSGEITVAQPLDHQSAAVIILTIQAKDLNAKENIKEQIAKVEISIYIQAYNDSNPIFTLPGWSISNTIVKIKIPEEQPFGTVLMTLTAKDPITSKFIKKFEQIESNTSVDEEKFVIIEVNSGNVILNKRLDFESLHQKSLRFQVLAISEDGSHNSELTVVMDVEDINDNSPEFSQKLYNVQILESTIDTPQGGVNQRKSTAMVRVEVLDVNDNAPQFSKPIYSAVVPENVIVDTQVTIVAAHDPDEVLSGQIIYEISDEGEANGLFQVNMTTGNVTTQRVLTGKGRAEPYQLIIRAHDKGEPPLFTDVILNVHIGDVFANDGVPIFIHPELEEIAQISENSSIGSPVFQVLASDPDDPNSPNGKIKYTFLNVENDANVFSIDSISGLITTSELLDREIKQSYSLLIIAQDQGDPPQQATRLLQVNVTDIDDNIPLFKRGLDDGPAILKTLEEVPIGTEIGIIEAVDKDIGENGKIDYIIIVID